MQIWAINLLIKRVFKKLIVFTLATGLLAETVLAKEPAGGTEAEKTVSSNGFFC